METGAEVLNEIHTGNHFSEDDPHVFDDGSAFYCWGCCKYHIYAYYCLFESL